MTIGARDINLKSGDYEAVPVESHVIIFSFGKVFEPSGSPVRLRATPEYR